jgi:rubrerythrin
MSEELMSVTNIIITASLLVNLITLTVVLNFIRKSKQSTMIKEQKDQSQVRTPKPNKSIGETGAVFCRNCGKQYESTQTTCPDCKTPR